MVKLIDFGIAKPADEDGGEQRGGSASIGSLSLTPGYAAPERMTSSAVTTAADIYSLGKLLEKLLPPGPGDRELKAIIARATADEPLDRYPTADALGADVAAWRDGLPGRGDGRRAALSRAQVRRPAPPRRGGGATCGLAPAGRRASALTLLANARAERARAPRPSSASRRPAPSPRPCCSTPSTRSAGCRDRRRAREHLARTGLAYLEALAADASAPLDVRVEAGRGYLRLAQVVGGGQASQLGRYEDANALLARSEQILAPLVARPSGRSAARQAMAALLIEQSAVNLYNNNEVDRARGAGAAGPGAAAARSAGRASKRARLNADAIRAEGDSYLWAEDYARARAIHLRARGFIAGLPPAMQRDPRDDEHPRRQFAAAWRGASQAAARWSRAQAVLDRAVAINRAVLATQPDDPLFRRRVVTSLRYRAIVHRTNDRDELARQSIEQARAEARSLRDRDPSDVGALQLFAVVSEVYMQTLSDLGRHAEAYRIGERSAPPTGSWSSAPATRRGSCAAWRWRCARKPKSIIMAATMRAPAVPGARRGEHPGWARAARRADRFRPQQCAGRDARLPAPRLQSAARRPRRGDIERKA